MVQRLINRRDGRPRKTIYLTSCCQECADPRATGAAEVDGQLAGSQVIRRIHRLHESMRG